MWQADLDKQMNEVDSVLKQRTEELEQCRVRTTTHYWVVLFKNMNMYLI